MVALFRHRGFTVSRTHKKKGKYTTKKPPVKKGRVYRLYIRDISKQGDGVGRIGNFAIFVPGAAIDETLDVKIIEVKKNCAVGKKIARKPI